MHDLEKQVTPVHLKSNTNLALIVHHQDHYLSLLSSGNIIAESNDATLTVFLVSDSEEKPEWYSLPTQYENNDIILKHLPGEKGTIILKKELKFLKPQLVGMPLGDEEDGRRYLGGKRLESVIQQLTCPIYFLKSKSGWLFEDTETVFIPFYSDRNTRFAITTALDLAPHTHVTVGKVIPPSVNAAEKQVYLEEFNNQIEQWKDHDRFSAKILYNFDEEQAMLSEAENYDCLLTGASRGNQLARTLFGDYRNRITIQAKVPSFILREYQGKTGATLFKGWTFLDKLLPKLSREDRIEAYRQVRRSGRPSRDFYSMIVLSSGIAALGLILNSAAVIIGAMLVAPLMSAITGMGMAIIQGDLRFLMLTFRGVLRGSLIAVMTGLLFGLVNFHGDTTTEILSRTEPSTLDLIVAIISGVAAAYALSRKNVSNSLPGVAIAVALVPPLATVGVCLSIGFWGLAYGALQLFLANMVAIVFASSVVFASLGFRPNIDTTKDHRRIKVFQRSFIASGILVALMFSLLITQAVEDVHDASLNDNVELELKHQLKELKVQATITDWRFSTTRNGGVWIKLQLNSPNPISDEIINALAQKLEERLKKDVSLDVAVTEIDQIHVD